MKKILVTGSTGLLGNKLVKVLSKEKEIEIIKPNSSQLDLKESNSVSDFFSRNEIDSVIHCASIVGGILYNIKNQYRMATENSLINMNILNQCVNHKVKELISIGSSCCYPIEACQPFREDAYRPGVYEATNSNYALSKILMSEAIDALAEKGEFLYKTIIMSNLFGHQKHANTNRYHLINSVSDKCKRAVQEGSNNIIIGGTGRPRREFLDSYSAANFIKLVLYNYESTPAKINCGYYKDHTVAEYYHMMADMYGINAIFSNDTTMPDGVMQKKMNIDSALQMGWQPRNIEKSLQEFINEENA